MANKGPFRAGELELPPRPPHRVEPCRTVPTPRSVLLIKPGSLGDIVHALPALVDVRRAWPGARISWMVDPRWRPLLEGAAGVDELLEFPRETFRGPMGWMRFAAWLRGLESLTPDVAFDLQGLLRSACMGRAARAQILIGGTDAREGARYLYDVRAPVDAKKHAVDRYRQILAAGGIPTSSPAQFPLGPGQPPSLPGLAADEPFLLLHPYARGQGKSLSPEEVGLLVAALHPWTVVLAGRGPTPGNLPANGRDLLGKTTLGEFLWLARTARWVVSVDSGPAHIAAAVSDRVLCLHTWSDPRRVGPYNQNAWIWRGGAFYRQNLTLTEVPGGEGRHPQPEEIEAIGEWVRQSVTTVPRAPEQSVCKSTF